MKIQFLVISVALMCLNNTYAAVYFVRVKNDTPDSLYKVIVPQEDYEVLVPAGQTADFGDWINMARDTQIQIAVIAGEGEPIFVTNGPDIAACADDEITQSVVYWSGFPNLTDDQKQYQACCVEGDVSLELIIQPDGEPTLAETKVQN